MGLGRAARPTRTLGLGRNRAPAGRRAGALQPVARHPRAGRGPGPAHRRPGQDHPEVGRVDEEVALRPDDHGLPPRVGEGHRDLRGGRQALRHPGRDLPAPAREPQGRGGEVQPHRRPALVAHPARRRHGRGSTSLTRPVLPAARRRPAATLARRRPGQRPHHRRTRAPRAGTGHAVSRPPSPSSGSSRPKHSSRGAATSTPSHPSWPAPRSWCPNGSARLTSTSPRLAGP